MNICHFYKVNFNNIEANFTTDELHRSSLIIPFLDRTGNRKLCIVGQNPSNANELVADKTLHYIERYVFEKLPQYSSIVMLNLFSRVDTNKSKTRDLVRLECERHFENKITENDDFLIIWGAIKNQGPYNFKEKANSLKRRLTDKNVFKIDIGKPYAPHPGNRVIYYGNYCFDVSPYDFSDI
jgi:hypothetical protein